MSESSEKVYATPDYMRMHPSMCYRKIGDGTEYYDCIYMMLQAIIDEVIHKPRFRGVCGSSHLT